MAMLSTVVAGASAVVFSLAWWQQIQNSRANDVDFEIRDEAKEQLEENDSVF
ncbi:MAG: hypothetical protein HKN45_08885 [Flavobacteriales bacterium]|nr:hypothetical protein [Flavobacteriales bacterium]